VPPELQPMHSSAKRIDLQGRKVKIRLLFTVCTVCTEDLFTTLKSFKKPGSKWIQKALQNTTSKNIKLVNKETSI
jgi:predicted DNA-binding antitoxin AbrB/MazE fold protein